MLKIRLRLPQRRSIEPPPRAECQRNVEAMWLTGCLAPDFKTIADFRKDNGPAIRKVCREFIVVSRAGCRRHHGGHRRQQIQGDDSRDRNFTKPR